jgi:hypothetical protein
MQRRAVPRERPGFAQLAGNIFLSETRLKIVFIPTGENAPSGRDVRAVWIATARNGNSWLDLFKTR